MSKLTLDVILKYKDNISKELQKATKFTAHFSDKLQKAKHSLTLLEKQEKAIKQFKKLKHSLSESGEKLKEAQNKARSLAQQLNATTKPTKSMQRAFEQATKAANKLKQAHQQQQIKLQTVRKSLNESGINTHRLSQAQMELSHKMKIANSEIHKQSNRLKVLNIAHKTANSYARGYQGTVNWTKNTADNIRSYGTSAAIIGASMGRTGMGLLKPAADFEQDFSKVQALSGIAKGSAEYDVLRNQAIHLGATTSFTSGEVAQGQGYLAMAGFNTKQIEQSMPAVLNMTKAAGIEMGRVSDIASDISSGFKIPADEMGRVADVLTATFTGSNTTLEGLGETMKYLGPVAQATGQDFENMSAMVGLLGNVGIKGSQAGTSLRAAMLRLAGPPKMARDALAKLGVQVKDSKGNMRGMTDILLDIHKRRAKWAVRCRWTTTKRFLG